MRLRYSLGEYVISHRTRFVIEHQYAPLPHTHGFLSTVVQCYESLQHFLALVR